MATNDTPTTDDESDFTNVDDAPDPDELEPSTVREIIERANVVVRAVHNGRGLPMEHGPNHTDSHVFRGATEGVEVVGYDAYDILKDHLDNDDILTQWATVEDSDRFDESGGDPLA